MFLSPLPFIIQIIKDGIDTFRLPADAVIRLLHLARPGIHPLEEEAGGRESVLLIGIEDGACLSRHFRFPLAFAIFQGIEGVQQRAADEADLRDGVAPAVGRLQFHTGIVFHRGIVHVALRKEMAQRLLHLFVRIGICVGRRLIEVETIFPQTFDTGCVVCRPALAHFPA